MGCVTSGFKQKQNAFGKGHQKDAEYKRGQQIKKKTEFRSPTYTSIQDALEKRNGEIRRSSRHLESSEQIQILSKYRMSAEQNKCAVPKTTACDYGPMLIYNPGIIEEQKNDGKMNLNQIHIMRSEKVSV